MGANDSELDEETLEDIEGGAYINVGDTLGFDRSVVGGLSGMILAVIGGAIAVSESAFDMVASLIDSFTEGGVAWISAFTSDPAGFISTSFQQGASGFTDSAFASLGPFLPWIGTIVALGVVAMVTWWLDRSDSDVPGTGIDLPFVDNEGEEDE